MPNKHPKSINLLKNETSPYLLDHADNPVHWYPWGKEALEEAQQQEKPICLSIGYAACHWCHVMAYESFENQKTADFMNEHFINIKVDREERPDIDKIYMTALHHLGEQGGWPLTMFLKPDGKPYWGGTYFPPKPMFGKPSFMQAMEYAHKIFSNDRDAVEHNANALTQLIAPQKPKFTGFALNEPMVKNIMQRLCDMTDNQYGGMRGAPKFPQIPLFSMLLFGGHGFNYPRAISASEHLVKSMLSGGIYDHIGGGLHRYTVDKEWLVPHFEKMLYDNGLALQLMSHIKNEELAPLLKERAEEIIRWLKEEMLLSEDAFAASLDADQEKEEGKFYIWTYEELKDLLGNEDFNLLGKVYLLPQEGNWEGKIIFDRLEQKGILSKPEQTALKTITAKLKSIRNKRTAPARDDKILTDWNGLTIKGLVQASRAFDEVEWLNLGQETFQSITRLLDNNNRLSHCYAKGKVTSRGLLLDYAAMISAALCLYEVTSELNYFNQALGWLETINKDFWCEDFGGYFTTSKDADDVIIRGKTALDEATPSGNGIMAQNLAQLYLLTGDKTHHDRLETLTGAFGGDMRKGLLAHNSLTQAWIQLDKARTIIVSFNDKTDDKALNSFKEQTFKQASPLDMIFIVNEKLAIDKNHIAFGKPAIQNKPTIYICQGQNCSLPLTDIKMLAAQLAPAS